MCLTSLKFLPCFVSLSVQDLLLRAVQQIQQESVPPEEPAAASIVSEHRRHFGRRAGQVRNRGNSNPSGPGRRGMVR